MKRNGAVAGAHGTSRYIRFLGAGAPAAAKPKLPQNARTAAAAPSLWPGETALPQRQRRMVIPVSGNAPGLSPQTTKG